MDLNIPTADLDFDKITIFTSKMTEMKGYLTSFWQILSIQEKKQAKEFVNNNLKHKYILSHGLLRYILSSYTDIPPQNILYFFNRFNKPFLKSSNQNRIQFSMSHSKDYVTYALSLGNHVGIDIEWQDMDLNLDEIASFVLTAKELDIYQKFSKEEKFQAFYRVWTKKEAITKALGKGLYYPIKKMEIMTSYLHDNAVYINGNNKLHCACLCNLLENYAGAVASSHPFKFIQFYNLP